MSLFYYCNQIENDRAIFDTHETGHLKVMKKKLGEEVSFTDGMGNVYNGIILALKKNEAIIQIINKREDTSRELTKYIEITAGLSRWNRLSILIEKAVELGVKRINLVHCERSNYHKVNMEKVEKTARKALKQCGGTMMPEFRSLSSPKEAYTEGIVPILLNPRASVHINAVSFPVKTNVFIGPEGGFMEKELDEIRSISPETLEITLGERILRLETSAIVVMGYVSLS
ncbi:MAG: rRNA (uracil1498-N3)-methyltransferase [Thermotogaceae bacterium]|nr:rRNA (uracil1498-N3)-methyltransferase [Thermotogaceae bacterium]